LRITKQVAAVGAAAAATAAAAAAAAVQVAVQAVAVNDDRKNFEKIVLINYFTYITSKINEIPQVILQETSILRYSTLIRCKGISFLC